MNLSSLTQHALVRYLFARFSFFFLLHHFGFFGFLLFGRVVLAVVALFAAFACRGVAVVSVGRRRKESQLGAKESQKFIASNVKILHSLFGNVVLLLSRVERFI